KTFRGTAAKSRRHLHPGAEELRLVRQDRPGLRGVPAGEVGRRDGRRPHLRVRGRAARGADHRLHDRRLGAPAARAAWARLEPNHQRGARHQPRDLRHFLQAAGHHRVGMSPVERLPELVNGDPGIVRWARHMNETFMLEVGETQYLLTVRAGLIETVEKGPFVMRPWRFAIRAPRECWEKFW